MTEPLPAQPNQSIITGIALLQEVVTAGEPVGSRELARRMQIGHSTVNRILGTLVHIGMLNRVDGRKYGVGPGVHVLSAQSLHASRLIPASIGPLKALQALGATVALGTVWNDVVCYLIHARPDADLATTIGAHQTFPLRESVIGAVIERRERVIRWDRVDRKEVAWAASVGTPPVAAIAAVFPESHPAAKEPATRELIVRCATQIEADITAAPEQARSKKETVS